MNEWLAHWEPIWLFSILTIEMLLALYTAVILTLEYFYDAKIEEEKKHRKRITKNKVKVVIDSDGQAHVAEAPKTIDVTIEHLGERNVK